MADDLDRWGEHHALLFGLNTDRDLEMIAAWVNAFRAAGFDPAELREVSDWLAVHDAPRFRADHLAAIQAHMRGRQERVREPEPDQLGTCTLCEGAGRVIVPEPRYLAIGKWGTCAVLCSCPLGKWYGDRQQSTSRPPSMTIMAYAAAYPGWRETMKAHQESLRNPAAEAALRKRLASCGPGLLAGLTAAVDSDLGRIRPRKGS